MTIEELRTLTRSTIFAIDQSGSVGIREAVTPVRAALAERGLAPRCYVGIGRELTPDEVVEWYVGQLLYIVDSKAWGSMNGFINCVDKFCPEIPMTTSTP
jgi:hypothetical protein